MSYIRDVLTVAKTWLFVWLDKDINLLIRKRNFVQYCGRDGVLKELLLLAYEKQICRLIPKHFDEIKGGTCK